MILIRTNTENQMLKTLLLSVLAFFFPPLPVAILHGFSEKLAISVLLTLLAYFPGLIYSLWVVLSSDK